MANRVLRKSVSVFDEEAGYVSYEAGTTESNMEEGHADGITNPKAWISESTIDEDFGLIPAGWTREDFIRAAQANSPVEENFDLGDEEEEEDDDLKSNSVQTLREVAEAEGIELGEATKKADIISVIRDARNT